MELTYLAVQQAFSEAAYLSGYDVWALGRARVVTVVNAGWVEIDNPIGCQS